MPRELTDVLHYFLPESSPDRAPDRVPEPQPDRASRPSAAPGSASPSPPELPILGVPIGDREIVPTALLWNLAVETARLGGASIVLAPALDRGSPVWPEPGERPLGTELHVCDAESLHELHRRAVDLAQRTGAKRRGRGLVFVRIPVQWLEAASLAGEVQRPSEAEIASRGPSSKAEHALDAEPDGPEAQPFRWLLLLSSARPHDLKEALGLAGTLLQSNPKLELGVTIHGVRSVEEARQAFEGLNERIEEDLGRSLFSYGLLVDDLDVYRAIAAQKPIGLAHPQAPATRALMDVARLLDADARGRALG